MTNSAPRGRLAIAPPAPEAPSAADATQIVLTRRERAEGRAERSDMSGEFSRIAHSEDRATLPEMEPAPVPVIDLDDMASDRNDTIPAPTWLGDD